MPHPLTTPSTESAKSLVEQIDALIGLDPATKAEILAICDEDPEAGHQFVDVWNALDSAESCSHEQKEEQSNVQRDPQPGQN